MSSKLYVGSLAPQVTSEEISELFSTIGDLASCQLIADRENGGHKGFGFVEMASVELADNAKAKLNGYALHGKSLKIDIARPRER